MPKATYGPLKRIQDAQWVYRELRNIGENIKASYVLGLIKSQQSLLKQRDALIARHELLLKIEKYCKRRDMSESQFGKAAFNDPAFVADLKKTRFPKQATIDKASAFIRFGNPQRDKPAR